MEKEQLTEVSKRYSRSIGYISYTVKAYKKNNELLRELIEKRDQQLLKESVV